MRSQFFDASFALVRHGKDQVADDTARTVSIKPWSIDHLRKVSSALTEKVCPRKFKIMHSPLARARISAEILRGALQDLGVTVSDISTAEWLNCDRKGITETVVRQVLEPDTFTLLVGHQPDIEHFLGVSDGVNNACLFSREFDINPWKP